jgi:hypothetical protein
VNATHDELRHALGAYVLGSLDPPEADDVREHLAGCGLCREEYDRLAPLRGLLGLLDATQAEQGPVRPDDALLDRVLSRLARQRRGRRVRLAAVACAAVVAAGATWGVVASGTDAGPAPPADTSPAPGQVLSATDPGTGVRAEITMRDVRWGTALQITLSGVQPGQRCRLDVLAQGGGRETAATWAVPDGGYGDRGGGSLQVPGAASISSWRVDRFEVVTLDGETLVTVPVPPPKRG